MMYAKDGRVTQRSSCTGQFREGNQEQSSFGYVLLFVSQRCGWCAIIQRIEAEEWPILVPEVGSLSDILDVSSDLQTSWESTLLQLKKVRIYFNSC